MKKIDDKSKTKAENRLEVFELTYQVLIENLPQKIFLKDRNSVYLSCNNNLAIDLKIDANDIVGKTDYGFFPKELADKYRRDDKRIIKSRITEDIEEEYLVEGKKVFVRTVKTPVIDENKNVIAILGIFWDITEKKKAIKNLRKSQKNLSKRLKELTCLYEFSRFLEHPEISIEEILHGILDLIPAAFQYPNLICVKILFKNKFFLYCMRHINFIN